jgi:hypothetical protein
VALAAQRLRAGQRGGDAAEVVDLGDGDGRHRLALVVALVAEDAEGEQDDVDVALGEDLADDLLVGVDGGGVEVVHLDLRAEVGEFGGGRGQRRRGASGQVDPAGALAHQAAGGGQADLGGASEQQQGLGLAQGVQHGFGSFLGRWSPSRPSRPRRRARSETKRERGSIRARSSRKSPSLGYILASDSGRSRESFAR